MEGSPEYPQETSWPLGIPRPLKFWPKYTVSHIPLIPIDKVKDFPSQCPVLST